MQLERAFPIVIVDEDVEARHAGGRAVRRVAASLESRGFRVLTGLGYYDAARLLRLYHNASSLLVSIDGVEVRDGHWEGLEELLGAARGRNARLPIFLLGDERTAEFVPASVLQQAQAFLRLHEDSPDFLAQHVGESARRYLDHLLPPMFRALAEYPRQGSLAWPTAGHGGGVAFRKSPVGRAFYEFFGENTLRADVSVAVGELGSPLDHTGPIAEAERHAAQIFGSDHTLFVVNGASTANKIVWHGLVGRGDLVLCDRNCHASIVHAIVMTGARPLYLQPSRNGLGLAGPIARDQFTPDAIAGKVAAAGAGTARVRLLALTNSTVDGLCYNVDAITDVLGDAVDVLHFDEAWSAYANFHEFYAGHHAISSARPRRAPRAMTCATQAAHKLLAAFSQSSMIHLVDSETTAIDMERFNEAFRLHTSTSPQYGILASCDVAAAMMAQPEGRALVQDTLEEALGFRRAMSSVKRQSNTSWWFDIWQPPGMALDPEPEPAGWALAPGDAWHGFADLAPGHALLDPIKVTVLTPGLGADGAMGARGIPASIVTRFLASRRIAVEQTGLYSFLVLFSMGVTSGKWSTLVAELLNFRDLYDADTPVHDVLPALAAEHPGAYGTIGLEELCTRVHNTYCAAQTPRTWRCMYGVLPEMALLPADAYERLVRGRVERVEIDHLMNRTIAVTLVPSPPRIPLIVPGERITPATAAIHAYLLQARRFDARFPGLEGDIHGLRIEPGDAGRRYLVDCIVE
jgi:arginine decarboxylase